MKNQRIVNLRALAILIVVLGHSIILYSSEWNLYTTTVTCTLLDIIKKNINLIQMPLFFSISGYLFFYSQSKEKLFLDFVKDKSKRLLLPFVIFAFLWLLPIRLLLKYPYYQNVSPLYLIFKDILWGQDNGHLWFLQTLFLLFIIMFYICRFLYRKNSFCLYITIGIIFLFLSVFSSELFNIHILNNFFKYCIWFYFGFLINKYEKFFINNYSKVICLLFLFFSYIFYYKFLNITVIQYILTTNFILVLYNYMTDKYNIILYKISSNSFGIYLFHSPLIYITFTYLSEKNPIIVVSINFILWGGLSYVLSHIIKKSKLKFIIGD